MSELPNNVKVKVFEQSLNPSLITTIPFQKKKKKISVPRLSENCIVKMTTALKLPGRGRKDTYGNTYTQNDGHHSSFIHHTFLFCSLFKDKHIGHCWYRTHTNLCCSKIKDLLQWNRTKAAMFMGVYRSFYLNAFIPTSNKLMGCTETCNLQPSHLHNRAATMNR